MELERHDRCGWNHPWTSLVVSTEPPPSGGPSPVPHIEEACHDGRVIATAQGEDRRHLLPAHLRFGNPRPGFRQRKICGQPRLDGEDGGSKRRGPKAPRGLEGRTRASTAPPDP